MKPLFIVFEGLDGSGTSTQARMLVDHFRQVRGERAHLTTEPSGGPIGQMIRNGLSGRLHFSADETVYDQQLAYLFAADRHDHLWNDTDGVMKMLASGEHVVCTRYFFSSYAYHCKDEEDLAFVQSLNTRFPNPDAVIFIDIEAETSTDRLAERPHLDRYESPAKLRQVRKAYDRSFRDYSGPLLNVTGTDDPASIHAAIVGFISETFE